MAITNAEFGRQVGYHFSMASRVMSGDRLPSTDKLVRISQAFDLPIEELVAKHQEGAPALGEYLRANVHSKAAEVEAAAKATGTVDEKLGAGK